MLTSRVSPGPNTPRFTVVVTFFNQERWVDQALDSVGAQTERDIQLLITDDGSTDGTVARIRSWLCRTEFPGELIGSAHNVGLPAMLNKALCRITGRYVVILNGDDWMVNTRLAEQGAVLDAAGPRVGLVYSDLRVVDVAGRSTGETLPSPVGPHPQGDVFLDLIQRPLVGIGAAMFRREVLDVVGQWDETLAADDFDFLIRVAAAGYEFRYHPVVVLNYRRHGASLTGADSAVLAEHRLRALTKFLGRDRTVDGAIWRRTSQIALALHATGYDGPTTRRHLRRVLRRFPSRRVVRALLESHLRIPPGRLSPSYWIGTRRVPPRSRSARWRDGGSRSSR